MEPVRFLNGSYWEDSPSCTPNTTFPCVRPKSHTTKTKTILHDSPVGFSLHNKIIKDVLWRAQCLEGQCTESPLFGWDELRKNTKTQKQLNNIKTEKQGESTETQKQFKTDLLSLGIACPSPADPSYSINHPQHHHRVIDAFSTLIQAGRVAKQKQPVPWCSTCERVVSHLESESIQVNDTSCFVLFPHFGSSASLLEVFGQQNFQNQNFETLDFQGFLVWTTTPWSLVASEGIVLHPKETYLLVRNTLNRCLVVSKSLFSSNPNLFLEHWIKSGSLKPEGISGEDPSPSDFVLGSLTGAEISPLAKVASPLDPTRALSLLLSETVKISSGTGVLHIAPGCCDPDYKLGIKHGLNIWCPLDKKSKFRSDLEVFTCLRGASVNEASTWVLSELSKSQRLIFSESISHGQAHCFECKSRIFFRICNRWFFDLKSGTLLDNVLHTLDVSSECHPKRLKKKFVASVQAWKHVSAEGFCASHNCPSGSGVRVPALVCNSCDHAVASKVINEQWCNMLTECGIETKYRMSHFSSVPASCPACKTATIEGKALWRLETQVFDRHFELALASLFKPSAEASRVEAIENIYVEDSESLPWTIISLALKETTLRLEENGAIPALGDEEKERPKDHEAPKPLRKGTAHRGRVETKTRGVKSTNMFLIHNNGSQRLQWPFEEEISPVTSAEASFSPIDTQHADIFRLYVVQGMLEDSASARSKDDGEEKRMEKEKQGYLKAKKLYELLSSCFQDLSVDPTTGLPTNELEPPSPSLVEKYLLTNLHKTSVRIRRAFMTLDLNDVIVTLDEFLQSLKDLYIPLLLMMPSLTIHTRHVVLETVRSLASPLVPFFTKTLSHPSYFSFIPTSEDHMSSTEKKQFLSLFKLRALVASDKKRFTSKQETTKDLALCVTLVDNSTCEDVDLVKSLLSQLCDADNNSDSDFQLKGDFLSVFFEVSSCILVFGSDCKSAQPKGKGKLNFKQAVTFVWDNK
eukprot:TRINITY_DN6917_c0_g1_i1.p1 TRINITY_DN6917_c0_g1~~TRINITY_DN6917_c0_g1_i1.p1  ORF type:complete len:978 (-),score=175.82 TRINITY_DN6917_c0_g1_i1:12-2945(-)